MINIIINFFIIIVQCSSKLIAQEFINPESAVYNPIQKRYLISNFGNGKILEIDSLGKIKYFKQGLAKSLGMIIPLCYFKF